MTGRWINRDPIGEAGGVNLYVVAVNSPFDLTDSLGLKPYDEYESVAAAEKDLVTDLKAAGWASWQAGKDALNVKEADWSKHEEQRKDDWMVVLNNRTRYYVAGREKGAVIYCYTIDGKTKFTYGEIMPGEMATADEVKKGSYGRLVAPGGSLYDYMKNKLYAKQEHRSSASPKVLGHTHIVQTFSDPGNRKLHTHSNDPTNPLSDPDKATGKELGIEIFAIGFDNVVYKD